MTREEALRCRQMFYEAGFRTVKLIDSSSFYYLLVTHHRGATYIGVTKRGTEMLKKKQGFATKSEALRFKHRLRRAKIESNIMLAFNNRAMLPYYVIEVKEERDFREQEGFPLHNAEEVSYWIEWVNSHSANR